MVGIRLYLGVVGKGRPKTLGAPMQGVLGCARCRVGDDSGFWGERGKFLSVRSGVLCPPTLAQMLTILYSWLYEGLTDSLQGEQPERNR